MMAVVKRLFDFILAFIGIILGLPILIFISLVNVITMGLPIFFTQLRPGIYGKPFKIIKFRTMTLERDLAGNLLPDELRLTKFGNWLRKTSLDELPELINVIKGEMSLVGPRPLLMQYVERYTPEQAQRLKLKPGITGWAQVNGRNAISWEEKFALDIWYVNNWTLWLDIKILFATIKTVLSTQGINAADSATMPEFMGSTIEIGGSGQIQAAAISEHEKFMIKDE